MIPRLTIGNSELLAVPAVHNRSVFAEQVNRICRDETTRPEAIVVELSHDAVIATVAWLKELGVGAGCGGNIPCMFGLAKTNRRIHPRHREKAIRLQELHGVPLHQIAPEILRRELDFSPVSLLCLSHTDSIIEAIRSAVELGLPVYGIDLGEMADADRGQVMIQDPVLAQGNLADYVRRNASACVPHRDAVIDGRRETVMAARLKRLLQQYRRVLFTCGIGHWQELCARLSDPDLRPAIDPIQSGQELFIRVLVAPSLAIHQMDLFPELTTCYESLRKLPPEAAGRLMDFNTFCRAKLAAACECAEPENREATAAFSQFLTNLSLVNQCRVPDLFMTLHAAQAMISPAFASRLGEVLVHDALDWAKPEQWPNLPYLCGAQTGSTSARFSAQDGQAELKNQEGQRSAPFFLSHMSEGANQRIVGNFLPLRDHDSDKKDRKKTIGFANAWNWPPCETLLYGTAYAAAEMADQNTRTRCAEPFAGSLHDGVDVKATLRAIIRNDHRIQIKSTSAKLGSNQIAADGDEPTVFIFERAENVRDGNWSLMTAGNRECIREFIRNRARFDRVMRQKGEAFVVNMNYGCSREPAERLKPHVSDLRYLYGVVLFGSLSLNPKQSAQWLEECNYTRCPILRSSSMSYLIEHYRCEHKMELEHEPWSSTLIRLAIPYAKRRLIVVTSHPQSIPAIAFREASVRGINLKLLPLTQFPRERIEAIRNQYFVYPRDVNELDYSEEVQAAFGESPRKHLELLPARVRAQLNPEY